MGDHIVRREPPTRPSQRIERQPTAELPEQQLQQLIHNPIDDDLESELELIDAHPMVFPESTPESLPSVSAPRLAHTLRRDLRSGPVPFVPSLPPLPARAGMSTLTMPRAQRPTTPVTVMPRTEDSALSDAELPSTERPTMPAIPRLAVPAIAASDAAPRPAMTRQALASIDAAPSEPPLVTATPGGAVVRSARPARLALPIVLGLLTFGTLALLLLR
jgi:hypothetical protein